MQKEAAILCKELRAFIEAPDSVVVPPQYLAEHHLRQKGVPWSIEAHLRFFEQYEILGPHRLDWKQWERMLRQAVFNHPRLAGM